MIEIEKCQTCFWWECCACDGQPNGCSMYHGYDDEYKKWEEELQADYEEAHKPVHEKWKKKFLDLTLEKSSNLIYEKTKQLKQEDWIKIFKELAYKKLECVRPMELNGDEHIFYFKEVKDNEL